MTRDEALMAFYDLVAEALFTTKDQRARYQVIRDSLRGEPPLSLAALTPPSIDPDLFLYEVEGLPVENIYGWEALAHRLGIQTASLRSRMSTAKYAMIVNRRIDGRLKKVRVVRPYSVSKDHPLLQVAATDLAEVSDGHDDRLGSSFKEQPVKHITRVPRKM